MSKKKKKKKNKHDTELKVKAPFIDIIKMSVIQTDTKKNNNKK